MKTAEVSRKKKTVVAKKKNPPKTEPESVKEQKLPPKTELRLVKKQEVISESVEPKNIPPESASVQIKKQQTSPEHKSVKPNQSIPDLKLKQKAISPEKEKIRLKKNAKIALIAVCACAVFSIIAIKKPFHQGSAKSDEENTIQAELPESLPETTEPPTETETEETETTTEFNENAPFIDYDLDIDPGKPMIALTYDDGPAVGTSSKILDTLEEYHAHATFFLVGDNINNETKRIIRRAIRIGCELGNHSQSHDDLTALDLDDALSSLHNCDDRVYRYTRRYPQHIRPPYGAYNNTVREAEKRMFIYWSLDSHDWKLKNADKIYNIVLDNVSDGDIILLHDIHEETAEASEKLIPELLDRGYQLVTVSELMYYRNFEPEDSMVLFNIHPDEPLYDSLFGTVRQTDSSEDNHEKTAESDTEYPCSAEIQ